MPEANKELFFRVQADVRAAVWDSPACLLEHGVANGTERAPERCACSARSDRGPGVQADGTYLSVVKERNQGGRLRGPPENKLSAAS